MSHPRRSMIKDWPVFLKKFRKDNNLTVKMLADKLAISIRELEEYEAGIRVPRPYLKQAILSLKP